DRLGARGERPHRPPPRCREEPELPGFGGRHLRGELAVLVVQPDVGAGDRRAVAHHLALDDGLLGHVDVGPAAAAEQRPAARQEASPGSSPTTTGTPTSEPYSVQEPS